MHLLFEFDEQLPVQNSRVLFFGCDNDRVGFLDVGQVGAVGRDNTIADMVLEDFPKFSTLLGILPQDENGVRHSLCRTLKNPFAYYKTSACRCKTKRTNSSPAFMCPPYLL